MPLGFLKARGLTGMIPTRGTRGEWFRDTLTQADLIGAATVTGLAGQTVALGEFTVPAQQELMWGFGTADRPANQGYIYADINTVVPAQVEGTLALVVTDANNRQRRVVWSMRTEELRGSLTAKDEKEPLPQVQVLAKEDDRLVMELTFDAGQTLTLADSTILVPISRRYIGGI